MAAKLLVLFLSVSFSLAQIPSLGYCPDYYPKDDFDIDLFLGKWYEIEKYFSISDIGSRCVVTDYARSPSGKIYMSNEVTSRVTGVKRIIEGYVNVTGTNGEGKLNVRYASSPIANEQTLMVLDTDYDSYAVIWNCYPIGIMYTQNVWVMTRERLPTGPTIQKAYGVLDKFRINRTFFVKTDQAGCALAASELNAMNGITGISTIAEVLGEEQKQANKEKSVPKEESVLKNDKTTTKRQKTTLYSTTESDKPHEEKEADKMKSLERK